MCAVKTIVKPSSRRPVVEYLCGGYRLSERRACEVARYGRRTSRRIVPIVVLTGGALCLCAGTQIATPLVAGFVLSLAWGLASSSDGPFWASAIDLGGNKAGAACGILNTGSNFGGAIGPGLTPFIASLAGWSVALYFGCFVVMFSVVTWLLIDPTRAPA